jgi:hypothetical protein
MVLTPISSAKPSVVRYEARMSSPFGNIEVRGARENNHKISLDIPRRQITADLLTANAVNQT